jgi:stage V sporulation protein SpoVS
MVFQTRDKEKVLVLKTAQETKRVSVKERVIAAKQVHINMEPAFATVLVQKENRAANKSKELQACLIAFSFEEAAGRVLIQQ